MHLRVRIAKLEYKAESRVQISVIESEAMDSLLAMLSMSFNVSNGGEIPRLQAKTLV